MDTVTRIHPPSNPEHFEFDGNFLSYLKIALVNLALSIVTLGFYRFWGTVRTRRYLWSHTKLFGEPLEWTGTGKELFFGFLIVFFTILLPLYFCLTYIQGLMLRREMAQALPLFGLLYVALFYLIGVAHFRMIRYRLSRTLWRGIWGGSDERGWRYGLNSLIGYFGMIFSLFLLSPYISIRLWNRRWSAMRFGDRPFEGHAHSRPLYKVFFICVGLFILSIIILSILGSLAMPATREAPQYIGAIGFVVAIYILVPVLMVAYQAQFLRHAIGHLKLGETSFQFTATTKNWLGLAITNLLIIIFTLGLGLVAVPYRNWQFFVKYLSIDDSFEQEVLGQSSAASSRHGEGLADAFDIGAI